MSFPTILSDEAFQKLPEPMQVEGVLLLREAGLSLGAIRRRCGISPHHALALLRLRLQPFERGGEVAGKEPGE